MIKLLLSTILFCLFSAPLLSQEHSNWKNYPNMGIMHYTVIPDDATEEQNIYINDQFEPSKLTTKENKKLNSIKIRYNVKSDVMECKIGSQHSVIKSPEKIKEINVNGESFEYKKYMIKKDTTSGYLQRMSNGNHEIYAKYFFSSTKDKLGLPKLKSYYLLQNKGELPRKLNSANSLISNLYRNFVKQAKEFEKSNQLDLTNPKDFKKLLTYLDHLNKDIVASR